MAATITAARGRRARRRGSRPEDGDHEPDDVVGPHAATAWASTAVDSGGEVDVPGWATGSAAPMIRSQAKTNSVATAKNTTMITTNTTSATAPPANIHFTCCMSASTPRGRRCCLLDGRRRSLDGTLT